MLLDAINETYFRDRSSVAVVGWCVVSLTLHLVVTQFPRLEVETVIDLGSSTAPAQPLVSEIPVELRAETEATKLRAFSDDATKAATAPPEAAGEQSARRPLSAKKPGDSGAAAHVTTGAEELGDGGASAENAGAFDAGGAASFPLADLEPSRPGNRLLFDPFRAHRDGGGGGMRLLIDSSRLRGHSLGAVVAKLLSLARASDPLAAVGIDPIRDAERIFVQTPVLHDPNRVVMLVQHRIPDVALRARLDRRVDDASVGSPESGAVSGPSNGTRVSGDRFIVAPRSGLLAVAPEGLVDTIAPSSLVSFPPSAPASSVWVHVESPFRTFLGTAFAVPRTLRWIEVRIAPDAGGGLIARFEAESTDERTAPLDARALATLVSGALGPLVDSAYAGGDPPLPSVEFHAKNSIVVGICRLTESRLAESLERLSHRFDDAARLPLTPPR